MDLKKSIVFLACLRVKFANVIGYTKELANQIINNLNKFFV